MFTNVFTTNSENSPLGLCTTSAGNIYVFILVPSSDSSDKGLHIFKSTNGGSSFSSLTTVTLATIHGGTNPSSNSGAVAIDGSNIIHVVASSDNGTRRVAYATFDTSNDTWGTWESVTDLISDAYHQGLSLVLDSNGKPHVCGIQYIGTNDYDIYYTNKTGASWLAKEKAADTTGANNLAMLVTTSNVVELMYSYYIANSTVYRVTRNSGGTWGTPTAWSTPPTDYENHFPYNRMVEIGGTAYGGLIYHRANYSSYIYINNTDQNLSDAREKTLGITTYGGNIYIIYVDNYVYGSLVSRYKTPGGSWTNIQRHHELQFGEGYCYHITVEYSRYFANYTKINSLVLIGTTYSFLNFSPGTPASSSKSSYLNGTANILEPSADISTGSWKNETGGTTLYPSLEDDSNTTYAWYEHAVQDAYFEVDLDNPQGNTFSGAHYIYWKAYKKTGTQSVSLKCELRQGATVIASDTQTMTASMTEYVKQLTAGEISNITNYNDLRIRITILSVT